MSPLLYCAIGDSEEEFFQSNIARVLLLVEEDLKTLVNNFKRLFFNANGIAAGGDAANLLI